MRALLPLLLALEVHLPRAWACSCATSSPVEAAEATGVAYVGEVVSVGDDDGVGLFGCGSRGGAASESAETLVQVRVVEAILGAEEGATYTLTFYVGDQGGDCSIHAPDPGDRWILYGTDGRQVSLCSPDKPWTQETEDALREAYGG